MVLMIIGRLLSTIPVLASVGVLVFSLLYLTPGDPAVVIAGDNASPQEVEELRQSLGLDQPYFVRLVTWGGGILQGDLGLSIITRQPVLDTIAERVAPTVSLMLVTLLISVAVAIPLGVAAASRPRSWIDRVVLGATVLGFSVPVFVVGYIVAYMFGLYLSWLPVQGYRPISDGVWQFLQHMILPAIALSFPYIALIARMTRATMLEVLSQDYIRTARAKGVSRSAELYQHALGNAAVPIVTVVGLGVASLLGGAVVTESVFAIPGLGRLTIEAILRRDYPLIQGVVLFFAMIYVLINLIIDLSYTILDPRIRKG
ncbi:ABC transporter permease [Mesorhizobium sp.]|uniref:ABC transporter permease n=1 Tax=Mesorhizobium sp. TaxID=1871066 RepID=UPI000FE77A14|nr:ABC transporter permease [Mesorhizobium sp.]RWJ05717.1 MAG: ABC transporter permease [Mesorhizobium sp.]